MIWRWNAGNFRVRGDTVDIYPAGAENAVRIELFGDEVETHQGNQSGHRRDRRDPKSRGYISGIPLCYQQG